MRPHRPGRFRAPPLPGGGRAVGEPVLTRRGVGRRRDVGGARRGRRIEHVVDRHDHAHIERLGRPWRHDLDRGRTAEEARHFVDRPHRRRQPDPLGGGHARTLILAERVEPLEADRQVSAALGRRDGVHLVDDHRVDVLERLAGLAGEHQIQRLRRRDQDVGRSRDELAPVARGRVTRADADGDLGDRDAQATGRLADAHERRAQVALDIDAERLERRDVEDPSGGWRSIRRSSPLAAGGGRRRVLLVEDPVDGPEERRKGLAGSGGSDDEGVLAARDRLPGTDLRVGGAGKRAAEPVLRGRAEPLEHAMR